MNKSRDMTFKKRGFGPFNFEFRSHYTFSPVKTLTFFLILVLIGTIVLISPISRQETSDTAITDALFTATSAVTLTGLTVQTTSTFWTPFGQIVILLLILVSGSSYLSISTFLLIRISQWFSSKNTLSSGNTLGINRLNGFSRLTLKVVTFAIAIQILGSIALFIQFYYTYPLHDSIWQAISHAISSFNNSGFVFFSNVDNFSQFQNNKVLLITTMLITLIGGLGYIVFSDIMKSRSFTRLNLNSKLVVFCAGLLIIVGGILILVLEYQNPDTLGSLSITDKIINSLFQSVSSRSSGFSSLNVGSTTESLNFLFTGLMFVGGAAGSTAGGIKLNTLALIVLTNVAIMKGRTQIHIFGKEIPTQQGQFAIVIALISVCLILLSTCALLMLEDGLEFDRVFFDTVSAFSSVGFTTGIAESVSETGRLMLVMIMLVGRFGVLFLALTMVNTHKSKTFRYVQERVTIG